MPDRPNLQSYIREVVATGREQAGPYLTISRQYGACGIRLARALEMELSGGPDTWRVVGREVLEEAAVKLQSSPDTIDALRRKEPGLVDNLLQALNPTFIPSGLEVRHTITAILRRLAHHGHVILVGQGSAPATQGILRGLHVRVVAPLDWRVEGLARRHELDPAEARRRILAAEHEREYLRGLYAKFQPESVAFDLILDNSTFELAELCQMVLTAMRLKRLVR